MLGGFLDSIVLVVDLVVDIRRTGIGFVEGRFLVRVVENMFLGFGILGLEVVFLLCFLTLFVWGYFLVEIRHFLLWLDLESR